MSEFISHVYKIHRERTLHSFDVYQQDRPVVAQLNQSARPIHDMPIVVNIVVLQVKCKGFAVYIK
jgi:hypothetical protein